VEEVMTAAAGTQSAAPRSAKDAFLSTYENEHQKTMRVLRAYPTDKLDLKPHAMCKSAKELAWVFVMERYLGTAVLRDEFAKMTGKAPAAPDSWDEILSALEKAHSEFAELIKGLSENELNEKVTFFVAQKTPGPVGRMDFAWFLLHDQIHHRGQFSIYLRMAGGKVPSIYGPTADEPWM
jgi:uncharacterized damage-inducible protein DinB